MIMKRALFSILCFVLTVLSSGAQVTFTLDEVLPATESISIHRAGLRMAKDLHNTGALFSDYEPQILACSFAADTLCDIGEDVLFQMLLQAWCQHRPVVLTPDAVWMVISQGFSHWVNENPEKVRDKIVSHEGKKELRVETNNLFSAEADWEGLIGSFCSEIAKYTVDGTASLVADFSTTGTTERIASEITLMDTVKPFFEYASFYSVCGIPSITLTGTPGDWKKVLEKTRLLSQFGLDWWVRDLEPILSEFIKASEGNHDYWFWKDIVCKTRPRRLQGPSCSPKAKPETEVDGWFLKLFPFDDSGRTPKKVSITHTTLAETVCVPFRYDVVNGLGVVLSSTKMEMVAGIVGVTEDPETLTLTPKIGWWVRIPEQNTKSLK